MEQLIVAPSGSQTTNAANHIAPISMALVSIEAVSAAAADGVRQGLLAAGIGT